MRNVTAIMKEAGPNGNLERAIDRVRLAQHLTTYIKHAGAVDFLLIWSAGTFYIRALGAMPGKYKVFVRCSIV